MEQTPGKWRYYTEEGDSEGQYRDKCRSFTIGSDSRKHMFDTQAWKSDDDPHVWEEVEANAAHIVRCVNAHDGLVQALEALCEAVEMEAAGMAYDCGLGASEWEAFIDRTKAYKEYKQARQALALARGQG